MRPLFGRNRWFYVVVVIPTLIAAVYFFLIASDRYVSESRFVVKSEAQRPAQTSTLANLIQTTGLSAGQEQTNEVLDYIRSRNALQDVSRRVDVHHMYADGGGDLFSRYPAPFFADRFENLYKYYENMVDARLDAATGVAVLKVQAFSPGDAAALNTQLLGLSEGLVNRLNTRARANAIAENEAQVAIAESRVRNARVALALYRNQSDLLDPTKQAEGVFGITDKLIGDRAALQAQLDLTRRVAPGNPAIPALQSRVAALTAQIDAQNGRAVGNSGAISSKLTQYEALNLEQEFAAQMLTTANAQLAQARAEADRQQFYLERVVNPNTPDLPDLPHRLVTVLAVFGVLVCLYFIGWMLIVGILEHAPED